jgi:hypothetical protein
MRVSAAMLSDIITPPIAFQPTLVGPGPFIALQVMPNWNLRPSPLDWCVRACFDQYQATLGTNNASDVAYPQRSKVSSRQAAPH